MSLAMPLLHQAESLETMESRIGVYQDLLAKDMSGVLPLIAAPYSLFRQVVQSIEVIPSPQPPHVLDGSIGRPRFSISYNQLETLIDFNVSHIA